MIDVAVRRHNHHHQLNRCVALAISVSANEDVEALRYTVPCLWSAMAENGTVQASLSSAGHLANY